MCVRVSVCVCPCVCVCVRACVCARVCNLFEDSFASSAFELTELMKAMMAIIIMRTRPTKDRTRMIRTMTTTMMMMVYHYDDAIDENVRSSGSPCCIGRRRPTRTDRNLQG